MNRVSGTGTVGRWKGAVLRLGISAACLAIAAPPFTSLLAPGWHSPRLAVLAAWWVLLIIEASVHSALSGLSLKETLNRISWTHLPSILFLSGWAWLPLSGWTSQDSPLMRAEIVFGGAWILHLAGWSACLVRDALRHGRRGAIVAFGTAALVVFTGATLQTVRCDLTGDEPHYLLMAHSLWRDGDLDLSNNYASADARAFYGRGILQPQGNEHLFPDGRRLSHHPLGPVILLYPAYLAGGRVGAALWFSLLAAAALSLTLGALLSLGFKPRTVEAVGWIGLFASPFLLYGGLLFAEIPTALAVAGALTAAARKRWGILGLLLGFLPWMHNRNVLLVIPALLLLLLAYRREIPSRGETARFLLGWVFPTAALSAVYVALYGVWTPLGAHHEALGSLFSLERFPINFLGLLFDQEAGLWFYFPVFALLPAGWVLGWRRSSGFFQAAGFILAFYYLCMSFYQNLGLQPAARFLAPLTPLLLLAVAPALEALASSGVLWRRLGMFLFAVSAALNLLLAAVPWMRFNRLEGASWVLQVAEKATRLPWTRWEPAFHAPGVEWHSVVLSILWVALTAFLTASFLKSRAERRRA